jgi:hypothetical protein
MTIEVRQMVIKSSIGEAANDSGKESDKKQTAADSSCCSETEKIKQEVLTECQSWVLQLLERLKER